MSDLISRQAAIDAIEEKQLPIMRSEFLYDQAKFDGLSVALNIITELSSAQPEQLGTNLAEVGTDCISRQAAIDAARDWYEGLICGSFKGLEKRLRALPSAQPERTCVNCGRTANNGGWYADGRTRCPIEEHYALPKDGYCHLWEKRNVTDDDYPERREE